MRCLKAALLSLMCATYFAPAFAEGQARMQVTGEVLLYDTENVGEDDPSRIVNADVDVLLDVLQNNPDVTVVELNSTGGSNWASRQMADIIIDFGLDTVVNGVCSSSCVRILLAGESRSMRRGGRVGFHQFWWSPSSMQSYYENDGEDEGWDDPFQFAAWVYSDAQFEIHEHLLFMTKRGVDADFAIETLKTRPHDMWFPYRIRQLAAGVLTE